MFDYYMRARPKIQEISVLEDLKNIFNSIVETITSFFGGETKTDTQMAKPDLVKIDMVENPYSNYLATLNNHKKI